METPATAREFQTPTGVGARADRNQNQFSEIVEEETLWNEQNFGVHDKEQLVYKENYEMSPNHTYTGQMKVDEKDKKNFIPHGEGQMNYHDNRVYEGVFKNGQVLEGTLVYPNGDRYQGQFEDGTPQG